jgi:hypothetical protein
MTRPIVTAEEKNDEDSDVDVPKPAVAKRDVKANVFVARANAVLKAAKKNAVVKAAKKERCW